MKERRRAKRVPEYLPISYRILPNAKSEGFLTRDISSSGVRFLIRDFVPKGAKLELTVNVPGMHFSFQTRAEVRWIRKDPSGERYEVGVEFVNIPKDAQVHLIAYINSMLESPPKDTP